MKYALLIYSPSTADEYAATVTAPGRDPNGGWADYTQALIDAGALVAAEQLRHTDTATTVRMRGGDRLVTDGPFMETKEHLLGFYLIDVPDLDAALDWAARMPGTGSATIEVRPAATGMPWQQVRDQGLLKVAGEPTP